MPLIDERAEEEAYARVFAHYKYTNWGIAWLVFFSSLCVVFFFSPVQRLLIFTVGSAVLAAITVAIILYGLTRDKTIAGFWMDVSSLENLEYDWTPTLDTAWAVSIIALVVLPPLEEATFDKFLFCYFPLDLVAGVVALFLAIRARQKRFERTYGKGGRIRFDSDKRAAAAAVLVGKALDSLGLRAARSEAPDGRDATFFTIEGSAVRVETGADIRRQNHSFITIHGSFRDGTKDANIMNDIERAISKISQNMV